MYYVSLKNINQEKNLMIPEKKLQITDELLSYLSPNQTISPRYCAHRSNLAYDLILELLMELYHRGLIGVKFIIYCENEDPDMIHAIEFDSDEQLAEFVRKTHTCDYCDSTIDTKNIQVAFIIRDIYAIGDIDG